MVTGARAFITDVHITGDTVIAPETTLKNPGTVTISVPQDVDREGGYVYIPGTELFSLVNGNSGTLVIDSVPSGVIPEVVFASEDSSGPLMNRYSVVVEPGDTAAVGHIQWRYARYIYLNTSATGAAVTGTVYDFPVCIRLTKENIDFDLAKADGADIRFAASDHSFLPFEIERWNRVAELAEVWVTVDSIRGDNDRQYIVMYWGNPDAENSSAGGSVFDTSTGFQGVWHLAEEGNSTVYDATFNRFDGTQYFMSDSCSVQGVIGGAMDFDGVDDFIVAHGTADGRLDYPENGRYSLSLWAYADSVDSFWHGIAGKGHHQYYLQYKCFHDTVASWEFVEFQEGWNYSEYRTETSPQDKEWVYLTGIRDGERQYLYVNGELVADTALLNSEEVNRNTDENFTIGCHLQYDLLPDIVPLPLTFFNGKIDEVRVMDVVPDANWIKLCYMNQKQEDALVEFR
jgi:hypothetical protein